MRWGQQKVGGSSPSQLHDGTLDHEQIGQKHISFSFPLRNGIQGLLIWIGLDQGKESISNFTSVWCEWHWKVLCTDQCPTNCWQAVWKATWDSNRWFVPVFFVQFPMWRICQRYILMNCEWFEWIFVNLLSFLCHPSTTMLASMLGIFSTFCKALGEIVRMHFTGISFIGDFLEFTDVEIDS